jgi:Na+-translocating ferredoxin:NAD+ oxidoreductase RnfG subunit
MQRERGAGNRRLVPPATLFILHSFLFILPLIRASATTYLTQSEALAQAFPDAQVERIGHVLTETQMKQAADLAGKPLPSALAAAYVATRAGVLVGTAYFDAHRIHSHPQTLMIVVKPDGTVADVVVVAFEEPRKYQAPSAWLKQFPGRKLDDQLNLRKDIQGISGATLTARATTKAIRRTLALHAVLYGSRITDH